MSGILANKKIRSWFIIVAVGAAIWFIPPPEGVTLQAWRIFDIFVTTIVGFMLQPMPIGAISIVSLGITALLGLAKVSDVLAGFGNSTVWLVVVAFLLSRGFIQTGFGRRIALMIMRAIGHSTLRLSYSLVLSDMFFAPAMPSITARGGAFIYPIARGLCQVLGSNPGETARKAGAFLMMVASTGTCITSAMFLTAMAANPLAALLAEKAVGIKISWGDWALAGIVPGLVSLLIIPYVLYKIYPPELKRTPEAPLMAKEELEKMGPMDFNQKVMLCVFLGTITLWSTATFTGIDATTTAFLGLGVLLVTTVLTWRDCLDEYGAWDALIWLGVLVTLAGLLAKYGFVAWLAKTLGALFSGLHWAADPYADCSGLSLRSICLCLTHGTRDGIVCGFSGRGRGRGRPAPAGLPRSGVFLQHMRRADQLCRGAFARRLWRWLCRSGDVVAARAHQLDHPRRHLVRCGLDLVESNRTVVKESAS